MSSLFSDLRTPWLRSSKSTLSPGWKTPTSKSNGAILCCRQEWLVIFRRAKKLPSKSEELRPALFGTPGEARPFDPGVRMDTGAPLPHVLSSGNQTIVLFHCGLDHDPEWDGKTVTTIDTHDNQERRFAWMRFDGVTACLFGPPNDEALNGHPLWGHGLEFYQFHTVTNSGWIAELQERNRVHRHHKDELWYQLQHFVITFHDETLEVIARTYEVGKLEMDFKSAIEFITRRLLTSGRNEDELEPTAADTTVVVREALVRGDTQLIDDTLWGTGHVDDLDLNLLHDLLVTPSHHLHQEVAKQLQHRGDASTAPVVRRALEMGFDHLAYTCSEDDVIAKWYSWLLCGIGTDEAIFLLREYAASSNSEVAQAMQYRLTAMGL
jgi:hypothetical protein